jgi:hypothetical protein
MAKDYFQFSVVVFIACLAYFIRILEQTYAPNSFGLAFAYLTLFTPYRSLTLDLWQKYVHFNTDIVYPPTPVPEIEASKFSYDAMRIATNNFRTPAVVR